MALSDYYKGFDGWVSTDITIGQKPQVSGQVSATIGPSQVPQAEVPNSPYLRAPLPLPMQYAPDTLKQYNRPGLSAFRIAPLPPGGAPAINSASSTVTQSIIGTFVNPTGIVAAGPQGAVQFNNGSGSLGGTSSLTWDNINSILTITGSVIVSGDVTITGSITLVGTLTATVFNATTGFQVAGAASSGYYLRGNGTDFVAHVLSGSDIATGLVPLAYGGTDANLSATGGTSQVLKQSSTGAAITVGQLAASDLSNGTTGTGAVVLAGSPALTGSPTAPTQTLSDNSIKIATDAFVKGQGYVTGPIISAIQFVIDGGGAPPMTQLYGQISIPYNCTILGWTITADQSGSAVIDVLRSTYAGFPTTSSIAGTDKPTLSSAQKNTDSVLSGWGSTALSLGDELQFNLSSVTTCQRLNLTIRISIP